jgi:hypothetical protein
MNRYSEAVKADVRRRMGPPHRQSVAEISQELGIHAITLYKWRKAWLPGVNYVGGPAYVVDTGQFCKPEEDPFLLLDSSLKAIERILLLRRGLPLRRTWIEQPYVEEEITLLEEEVIPAIQQCLKRVDELDERLLAQQELLHHCQLETEREAPGALRLQMA